jgi:2Fe-2S ferredoxin
MPTLTFIQADGAAQVIDAAPGQSLMQVATGNLVAGIVGECGGSCSCATCHVYIDEPWFARLPPADEMEQAMLEGAVEPGPSSRLSCQIQVSDALDGLIARIPAGQV